MKRKEHLINPNDIELNDWEFRLVLGDAWEHLPELVSSIFCECNTPSKQLKNYKIYLVHLNDIVLRGKCSGCDTIAARYIETGENKVNYEVAE